MKKIMMFALAGMIISAPVSYATPDYMIEKPSMVFGETSHRMWFEENLLSKMLKPDWQEHEMVALQKMDGEAVFSEALKMMATAKKSICFGMYLFGGDIGDQVIDLLLQKQKEGVKIYMVLSKTKQSYDDASSKEQEIFEELYEAEQSGNPVVKPPYRQKMSKAKALGLPVVNAETSFIDAFVPVRVDHSKIIIVDGVEAMFGGMNFATTTAKNRDTMVRVAGPFVQELEKNFFNKWMCGFGKFDSSMLSYNEEAAIARMNDRGAEDGYKKAFSRMTVTSSYAINTREELIKMYDNAKESIDVEQLLCNDTDLLKAIARAAKRGVKVRLLLDPAEHLYYRDWHGGPNNKAAALVQKLKKDNPELNIECNFFKVGPGSELHIKMTIIDGKVLGIGSTNFSSGAFQSNYEMMSFMHGDIVEDYIKTFNQDWEERSHPAPEVGFVRKLISIFSDFIF